jgi:4-hydroxythreonine-4-phosphate dehydrogenase
VIVLGHEAVLHAAAQRAGIKPFWQPARPSDQASGVFLTQGDSSSIDSLLASAHGAGPTAQGGRYSFDLLLAAITECKSLSQEGRGAAIVTAPISKDAWSMAGIADPGHTEVLAREFASPQSAMLFVGPSLRVILVTTHIALRDVPRTLTTQRILDCIRLGARACRGLGIAAPRVALAGLNPHAGEGGLFGDEDDRIIAPAVSEARAEGIDATGPLPGDTVFLAAARKKFDLVVAMYHDQGLIPVKLLDREQAVNVTAGLRWQGRPVVRTSPAHGTAYDIAGKNLADPGSMRAAIELALQMVDVSSRASGPA